MRKWRPKYLKYLKVWRALVRSGPAVPCTRTAGSRRRKPREQMRIFTDFALFIPRPLLDHRERPRVHWETSLSLYKEVRSQGRGHTLHNRHSEDLLPRRLHSSCRERMYDRVVSRGKLNRI
jgi:hypothetical protein